MLPEWCKETISLKEALAEMKTGLFLGEILSWCVLASLWQSGGAALLYATGRLCPLGRVRIYDPATLWEGVKRLRREYKRVS